MNGPSLLIWILDNSTESLGTNGNRWLRVIEAATQNLQRSTDLADRTAFRKAALQALELAGRVGALPAHECVRRNLRIRATYILKGGLDQEWMRGEAASILGLFLRSTPADFETAARVIREYQRGGDVDPEDDLMIVQVKSLLRPLGDIEGHLDAEDRALIRQWLDLFVAR
jgi:hypothetical protein